jgi:hypothetical protein
VRDRGEPVASCSEWHGDGTAGEDDRASHLVAEAPARAMGEAGPGRHEPRWQAPKERGSVCSLKVRVVSPIRRPAGLPCAVGWLRGGNYVMMHLCLVAWEGGQDVGSR